MSDRADRIYELRFHSDPSRPDYPHGKGGKGKKTKPSKAVDDYEGRVRELENEGMTTSDAQGVADAEIDIEKMLKNKKKTALEKIKEHPLVESYSDERGDGEGFWIYLKEGYVSPSTDTGTIHEDTISAAVTELKHVQTSEEYFR